MDEILRGLNDRQIEAVTSTEGYVRIIAGAGSGKTKALTHRYAFIVKALGVPSSNVLCVTFTNKAANEMKKRVRALIGDGYDTSLVTTYHGFCVRVLRESISKLFYPENFIILDKADQKTILEEIYEELEIKLDKSTFEKIIKKIDQYKRQNDYVTKMMSTEPFSADNLTDIDGKIVEKYLQRQRKVFALDFNDLVNFTFKLFELYPDVLSLWQERLNYIQVDEFQDSSARELLLVDMLSAKHKNLFVVGDPDQNIYEWRGAKVEILVDFDKTHDDTKTVLMERNYRSTPQILNVANSLIDKNKIRIKKTLYTKNPDGPKVICVHHKTEREEAEYIAARISDLKSRGYAYKDITVLYRANYLSRFVEQGLYTKGIPYTVYGGVRFYDRMEIKDALCYLRLIVSKDDYALLRVINVPKRKFGKAAVVRLKQHAAARDIPLWVALKELLSAGEFAKSTVGALVNKIEALSAEYMEGGVEKCPISQLFSRLLEETGYEKYIRENGDMERLENLAELKKNITDFERSYLESASVERYLEMTSLYTDEDDNEKDRDVVKLMTVHTSKGLEFPVVFICGLSDGIFPSSRALEERKAAAIEEERRLMFVGVTRAEYELYLTDSEGFTNQGKAKSPSRFIYDIAPEALEFVGKLPPREGMPKNSRSEASIKYSIGDEVVHAFFGNGVIRDVDIEKCIYTVYFEKLGQTRPISFDYSWPEIGTYIPSSSESTAAQAQNSGEVNAENNRSLDLKNEDVKRIIDSWSIEDTAVTSDMLPTNVMDGCSDNMSVAPQPAVDITFDDTSSHNKPSNKWNDPNFPKKGWISIGITDLGQPSVICEMCGEQLVRYLHTVEHYQAGILHVGRVCAGKLEGSDEAVKKREADFRKKLSRKKSFMKRQWKVNTKGTYYIKVMNKLLSVYKDKFNDGFWCVAYDGEFLNRIPSFDEAKDAAFELVDKYRSSDDSKTE